MEIEDRKFDDNMKYLNSRMDEVLRLLKATNRLNGDTLLDSQDLCLMLNLSKRTLQRYRNTGMLPYIQIGGKPFYLESEVEKFVHKNKQDPPDNEMDK